MPKAVGGLRGALLCLFIACCLPELACPAFSDAALGRGPPLSEGIRKALMADATKTLDHELVVVPDS